MDRDLDDIDSGTKEELETIRFLDNLFKMTGIILGVVGMFGLLITIVIWFK
jgi:hypothetical protein